MAAAKNDLTPYAKEGFVAQPGSKCPHYTSSPAGMAWCVGAWMRDTGRTEPRDVRMSRGYKVRVNDMLVNAEDAPKIERIN
ncbi:hypothetical protein [Ralstonia pseudosolanacearum]|uniref:hypothetical protein n=1 Tax=Ralstonia pseudosolanacearum TaxID=1310165 RepID=UPI003CEAD836